MLILPWKSHKVGSPTIEFKCPQCFEEQKVSARYADAMLFNGVVKFAGESVVAGFSLTAFDCADAMDAEMKKLMAASESELASPSFVRSIASLAGRKDIVETGATKVGGKNAFWCTTRMVRRVGNQVVYRGLQRVYLIPMKNGIYEASKMAKKVWTSAAIIRRGVTAVEAALQSWCAARKSGKWNFVPKG